MSYPDVVHKIRRGDSYELDVVAPIDPATGQPFDVTATTFWFTAKRSLYDADVDAVIAKDTTAGVVIVDGPAGQVRVALDPTDTDALTKRTVLRYDVQWEDTGGGVRTIESGDLIVEMDVTRRTA